WGIEEPEDLIDAQDEEPIKRLLNNMLYQAAKNNASDVHIDSSATEVVVRFRVDGVLHNTVTLPKSIQRTLINRIKVMSRLDISQHALPQDGRTLILIACRKIDIRVSIMPTVHGEKAVLRLLYQDKDLFNLRQLGMPEEIYASIRKVVAQSGGIILVSGPTGSGKTTTLYAALTEIDHHQKNIMTIEDPVEYKIAGYVQIEVNPKLGLTFANALRSVLRQDPDVIMVGEIRDRETAQTAVQAALTGHLLLSTMHTNDAVGVMTRLSDLGIDSFLISDALLGVIAQRLVRRNCDNCREEYQPSDAALAAVTKHGHYDRDQKFYHGVGCDKCSGTGFHRRIPIFESLVITPEIKKLVESGAATSDIHALASQQGMTTLADAGFARVLTGETTVEEVRQKIVD
ncbi:MAG: type II/IV secretion system protein, partial [Planctomycetes bacterium]|nr:type II/IV secretion system protein [Planctomycetota bacterium]